MLGTGPAKKNRRYRTSTLTGKFSAVLLGLLHHFCVARPRVRRGASASASRLEMMQNPRRKTAENFPVRVLAK